MATKAPPKSAPKGKGLSATLQRHKYIVAAVVLVVGYLVYRWYKSRPTSAGTGAQPAPPAANPFPAQDSTGGGSSGGGGDTGTSNQGQAEPAYPALYGFAPVAPMTTTPLPAPTATTGGGNTAPPVTAKQPSASFGSFAQIAAGQAALNQETILQPAVHVASGTFSTAAPLGSLIVPGPIVGGVAKPATVYPSRSTPLVTFAGAKAPKITPSNIEYHRARLRGATPR